MANHLALKKSSTAWASNSPGLGGRRAIGAFLGGGRRLCGPPARPRRGAPGGWEARAPEVAPAPESSRSRVAAPCD